MYKEHHGLTSEEVKKRQVKYGLNSIPEKPPPGTGSLLLKQFQNPFIYILLLAFIITLGIGHLSDAVIISLAIFINTILGFVQEQKASRTLSALKNYYIAHVTVYRDGKRSVCKTTHLVPDDIVVLAQGTKVPADGVILHANRCHINESVLTGESMPVEKVANDQVFMGTILTSGQALMRVVTTGKNTRFGEIAEEIQEPDAQTPLQQQLSEFSKKLLWIIAISILIVFCTGLFYKFPLSDIFLISVALAVSSIPEGLIVSLTVVLAIGMQRILQKKGLVKTLQAAETLGNVTVICTDKTGTLTEGQMKVEEVEGNVENLAKQVLLANDLDDPIVIAAFEWGRTIIQDFVSTHPRIDSIPFSSHDRFFACLNTWSQDNTMLFINGAPEILLEKTNLSKEEKTEIRKKIHELSTKGKRLVGYSRKLCKKDLKEITSDNLTHGFEWVGILAFADPIRAGVEEALKKTHDAGIRTIVITGDYPQTARAVMSELGMTVTDNEVMIGTDLEKIPSYELQHTISSVRLFARTTPDQKLKIVEALKHSGQVVAMMGDGVNDAPAIHRADIGIVVDGASDVAKDAADLILLDSNFSTVVAAIEEGRVIFENIRKIILYLMSDAFAEMIVVLGGIVLNLPLPLTAVQILWINLVSDGLPSLALTVDPLRKGVMHEKPREKIESLITPWMLTFMITISLLAGCVAFVSYIVMHYLTQDLTLARSFVFIVLGMITLGYVFSVRTYKTPVWKDAPWSNTFLLGSVIVGLFLQIVPFSLPETRQFFGVSNLHPLYWLSAVCLSFSVFLCIEILKIWQRTHAHKRRY